MRRNTESFVKDSSFIHNNKYDYSVTVFTKICDKVIIICPIHGEFEQEAKYHLKGGGCRKCSFDKSALNRRFSLELAIIKFKELHGDRYDYSQITEYSNSKVKLPIICKEHGIFYQSAASHLQNHGCQKCTHDSFIGRFSPWRMGKNSNLWKGGRSTISELIRKISEYSQWRTFVYKRDNYTCTKCGNKGKVEVDHIVPFYKLLEENGIDSVEKAKSCAILWDTNNGRTLCEYCHKKTDTYGNKESGSKGKIHHYKVVNIIDGKETIYRKSRSLYNKLNIPKRTFFSYLQRGILYKKTYLFTRVKINQNGL